MNGRFEQIENALLAIDPTGFQKICDAILYPRETGYITFSRTGSQLGKRKTTKGTPDTFFKTNDGKLGYIEYTTTEKGIVGKICADILDHIILSFLFYTLFHNITFVKKICFFYNYKA